VQLQVARRHASTDIEPAPPPRGPHARTNASATSPT
jgi:hypothetical protein